MHRHIVHVHIQEVYVYNYVPCFLGICAFYRMAQSRNLLHLSFYVLKYVAVLQCVVTCLCVKMGNTAWVCFKHLSTQHNTQCHVQ